MISIIIPTLNEEKFITRLLTSLKHQTYKDFEVIISDGGSHDKTVEKAKSFGKYFPVQVVVEKNQAHKGPARGRNMGADKARGEWLLFVDADGILFPYTLERAMTFMQAEKAELATCWFATDGKTSGDALFGIVANIYTELSIIVHKPLASGVFMCVKKNVFFEAGTYNEKIYFGEDYELTQRIVQAGHPLHIIRETLIQWSLRRIKKKGKLYYFRSYAIATILTLLVGKKYFKYLPGYQLGGQLYARKSKKDEQSPFAVFNNKVKLLLEEMGLNI